jgi:DUF4097 and DUF4098 domain-containing protein YvlB
MYKYSLMGKQTFEVSSKKKLEVEVEKSWKGVREVAMTIQRKWFHEEVYSRQAEEDLVLKKF